MIGTESDRGRAQTAQDFAVGISLFLLVVAFTFAFLPNVIAPFQTDTTAGSQAQVDRLAADLVHEFEEEPGTNQLEEQRLADHLFGEDGEFVRDEYALPFTARVNITIENVQDQGDNVPITVAGEEATVGETYRDDPSVSKTRIVEVVDTNGDLVGDCEPACRLTVRIW